MPPGGTHQHPNALVPVSRPVGQNDVGMVAWTLTLKTPECPQGRKVCFRQQSVHHQPPSVQHHDAKLKEQHKEVDACKSRVPHTSCRPWGADFRWSLQHQDYGILIAWICPSPSTLSTWKARCAHQRQHMLVIVYSGMHSLPKHAHALLDTRNALDLL